jgi:hypothetical protein
MNDECGQKESNVSISQEHPENKVTQGITVEDAQYIIDRLVVVGWLLTSVSALTVSITGFVVGTVWITFGTVMLSLFDVVLYFHWNVHVSAYLAMLVVLSGGAFVALHVQGLLIESQRKAQETETHGWLLPANDPMPHNSSIDEMSTTTTAHTLFVLLGSTTTWLADSDTRRAILGLGGRRVLSMWRKGDKVAVDADFFAPTGNLAARIERNEFHLISGEYSFSRRSQDLSALSVFDKKGNLFFSIHYLNPRVVKILGTFLAIDSKGFLDRVIIDNDVMHVSLPVSNDGDGAEWSMCIAPQVALSADVPNVFLGQ